MAAPPATRDSRRRTRSSTATSIGKESAMVRSRVVEQLLTKVVELERPLVATQRMRCMSKDLQLGLNLSHAARTSARPRCT